MKSIGFKEWAIVCEALGSGRQSLILRKGGIAEGKAGFAFRHPEFFLFPTFFHEQIEKTRLETGNMPLPNDREITLRFFTKVEHLFRIESWSTAAALGPLHILQESVVRERFEDERASGIHVAFVRVFRVEPEWILPNEKRYGGCRSWLELPAPPQTIRFCSVLSDTEHHHLKKIFRATVGESNSVPRKSN
jgi:hypothetical protein